MNISNEQYELIKHCLPKQRGNVSMPNLQVLNAILFIVENGAKWRSLPKEFGNLHTVYTRMNRWAKSGVLDKLFVALQNAQIIKISMNVLSLDSAFVKVHPDGTDALKKATSRHREIKSRMDDQNSYGCCERKSSSSIQDFRWQLPRCSRGQEIVNVNEQALKAVPLIDGQSLRGQRNPPSSNNTGVYACCST